MEVDEKIESEGSERREEVGHKETTIGRERVRVGEAGKCFDEFDFF